MTTSTNKSRFPLTTCGNDGGNAFLLAATHSGAGKTTISIGLMAALINKGLEVQPFKCGPDFIDPTLHQLVTGKVSRNLDLKMCGPEFVSNCFARFSNQAEISVVEGVMGLFDGGEGSGAALAGYLGLPVVLVVDVRSCAESIAAVVKGFETLDPDLNLAGVIFNQVGSSRHLQLLRESVQKHCRTEILGALYRNQEFTIPDRHLGLFMGDESPLDQSRLTLLADKITENINLDRLLELTAFKLPCSNASASKPPAPAVEEKRKINKIRLAVARDKAFCFYYQDNLELFEDSGAELVFFSPLTDNRLPEKIDGIYLGGGYPELYARQLSDNKSMLKAIRQWGVNGGPLYAECGGFIYLCQGIVDQQESFKPMAGLFPVRARMRNRLARLGYRHATIKSPCFFGDCSPLYGHEFHYSEIDEMPDEVTRVFTLQDGRDEGYQIYNTLGSYLHLHFGRSGKAVKNFINFCKKQGGKND